jgi:methylated-DNA-[protein]-cysteine S-methyltransferase
MSATGYTLFNTPIGRCAIAWNPRGVAGVWLPEDSDESLQARLRRRFTEAPPPPEITDAIAAIRAA